MDDGKRKKIILGRVGWYQDFLGDYYNSNYPTMKLKRKSVNEMSVKDIIELFVNTNEYTLEEQEIILSGQRDYTIKKQR